MQKGKFSAAIAWSVRRLNRDDFLDVGQADDAHLLVVSHAPELRRPGHLGGFVFLLWRHRGTTAAAPRKSAPLHRGERPVRLFIDFGATFPNVATGECPVGSSSFRAPPGVEFSGPQLRRFRRLLRLTSSTRVSVPSQACRPRWARTCPPSRGASRRLCPMFRATPLHRRARLLRRVDRTAKRRAPSVRKRSLTAP